VSFIQGNGVRFGKGKRGIGTGDKSDEDGNLSGKADHAARDIRGGKQINGVKNIPRVGGMERSGYDEDLTSAVCGGVTGGC
jgi:hypothetical protein